MAGVHDKASTMKLGDAPAQAILSTSNPVFDVEDGGTPKKARVGKKKGGLAKSRFKRVVKEQVIEPAAAPKLAKVGRKLVRKKKDDDDDDNTKKGFFGADVLGKFDRAPKYRNNNLAWLTRREGKQAKKVREQHLNWKYDVETRGEIDLGKIKPSWCFLFNMKPNEDDSEELQNKEIMSSHDWTDTDRIPLEAWQFCHRLWKFDFTIDHSLSVDGTTLIVTLALPFKMLLEEARENHLCMRLERTKGSHNFSEPLLERYPSHSTNPFSSGVRQVRHATPRHSTCTCDESEPASDTS